MTKYDILPTIHNSYDGMMQFNNTLNPQGGCAMCVLTCILLLPVVVLFLSIYMLQLKTTQCQTNRYQIV